MPSSESNLRLDTRYFGWFVIFIATVMQLARILGITAPHGELPFLSANDRSRWCAIAALTEDGRWEIDKYIEILDSKGKSKIWNTIDMVKHRGADGIEHSYSSKPPLLTLMIAAICKPITMAVGKTLTEDPFLIGRLVLVFANVLPLCLWWCWFHRWLEAHVPDGWTRWSLLNASIWGSFLTTFVATLNNHLHGALFFSMSSAFAWQIIRDANLGRTTAWGVWLSAGVSAAMTVACELPALAWVAAVAVILLFADWKRLLLGFGFGSAMIAAAFLLSNLWAHGDWRPPYSHRGLGPEIGIVAPLSTEDPDALPPVMVIAQNMDSKRYPISSEAKFGPARLEGVHQLLDASSGFRIAIQKSDSGWKAFEWDDWYDFPKSYWLPGNKRGVDRGEPNRWWYLLHFTLGHHGVLSLTPLWIWSIAGAGLWLWRGSKSLGVRDSDPPRLNGFRGWILSERCMAAAIAAVTIACIVFYTSRDTVDRNYAGVCSGFRWLFWLIPAWLWLAAPAVQACSRHRWARVAVLIAIGAGVLSATLPWPNPWSHPWPYRLLIWLVPESFQ